MSDIIFNRDEEGKPLFIRISSSTTETKREEIMGNFLMAKSPSGEPILVRATEDGRLMTDGQGGGGGSSDGFLTIGGVTAKEPNDMLYFVAGTGIQIVPDNDLGTITFAVTGGGGGGDVPDGTLDQKGIVQLSNVIDEDETKAATPSSVYWVKEIALAAGEVASTDATTEQKGRVQLYPGTDSDRDDLAATPGAVREAYLHVEDHVSTHLPGGSDELPLATIGSYGLTALSGEIDSTADDVAATPSAVKQIADLATRAASDMVAGVVKLYSGVDSSDNELAATAGAVKKAYDDGTRSGTTTQFGQVKLYGALDSTSDLLAATAGAVRQANINGTRAATDIAAGQVVLDTTVTSTSTTKAATASAVKKAYDDGTRDGTTEGKGQVQIYDGVDSESTSLVASASAVKKAYDDGTKSGTTEQKGQVQIYDGIDSTSNSLVASANAVRLASLTSGGMTGLTTLHVDGIGGDDNNDGMSTSTPFKTIAKAISTLNQISNKGKLDYRTLLRIRGNQTYAEGLFLAGYYGQGAFNINGRWSSSETHAVITGLTVNNCTSEVTVEYFSIRQPVNVSSCFSATIRNITMDVSSSTAITVKNSNCSILTSTFSNKNSYVISAAMSLVLSSNNTGSNNSKGLIAGAGSTIVKVGTQATATTPEVIEPGGLIRT